MKYILVFFLVFISGCALPTFPKWPEEVTHVYVFKYDQQLAKGFCGKFKILSTSPFITKFESVVDIMECDGVEGFIPDNAVSVKNFLDDVNKFSKDVKCKLK